ncbi:DUF2062 domain-containing protein [Frigidibacter oleivorans]|uniref:DUF2062 domain-containing protein n=1 Tax=Frigidibacter oleivorans TaxID=2487129 RepID=UPI000F8DFD6A|nr:DUF2062 domain-containing protein [Frigidibacter oleivorans]
MVFKRRIPRSYLQVVTQFFYPRGGWLRAATYTWHRLRRLPDEPHRIARGVGAGIFISFTPLFGIHFFGGGLLAWLIRGNIFAALIGTFAGNPVTIPFIAISSVTLGRWMLGVEGDTAFHAIVGAFSRATQEMWWNVTAMFTDRVAHWSGLDLFFDTIFLPYLVGGLVPGLAAGIAGHYLTLPLIAAYQKRRGRKLRERAEKLRAAARSRAEGGPG